MGAKQKLLTVASNGQISIGKEWAGRHIILEEVSNSEIIIKSGTFIPDSQAIFFSESAIESLNEFNKWEETNLQKNKSKSSDTLAKLKQERQKRGK